MTAGQGMLYGGLAALGLGVGAMVASPLLNTASTASVPVEAGKPAARSQGPTQAGIRWNRLDAAIDAASKAGKPVFVTVYADWCGYCKLMERTTFVDAGVVRLIGDGWVAARLNGESQTPLRLARGTVTEAQWALGNGVQGFPASFLLDSKGKPFAAVPGYIEAPQMSQLLKDAAAWLKGGGESKLGDFYDWAARQH